MVWPTATVGPVNETLLKESVSDIMSNLFPLDTTLHQLLGREGMDQPEKTFPLDYFSTALINRASSVFNASAAGASTFAKPEGHTYTDRTPEFQDKIKSVVQIYGDQFSVSGTEQVVSTYAIADRFAHELMKTMKGLLNMQEFSFWWSPGTKTSGADMDSTNGTGAPYLAIRQTQGLMHWILKSGLSRAKLGVRTGTLVDGHDNNFGSTSSVPLGNSASWAYDAGGLAMDQAMFKDSLMAPWYRNTGEQAGAVGFASARMKNLVSTFAHTAVGAINERTIGAEQRALIDTIDVYETDFGAVKISLCRQLELPGQSVSISQSDASSTTVLYDEVLALIKPEYYSIGELRPMTFSRLGKTGDFEQGLCVGESGLICRNPSAGAAIVNAVAI